jgi:multiple sugar transport system permease protein
VLIWTMLPIYHLFLFAISPKDQAMAGKLWPDSRRCTTSRSCSGSSTLPRHFWLQMWNSLLIAVAVGADHADRRHRRALRDQPAQGAGRPHGR